MSWTELWIAQLKVNLSGNNLLHKKKSKINIRLVLDHLKVFNNRTWFCLGEFYIFSYSVQFKIWSIQKYHNGRCCGVWLTGIHHPDYQCMRGKLSNVLIYWEILISVRISIYNYCHLFINKCIEYYSFF